MQGEESDAERLQQLAHLIRQRNAVEVEIARIVGRPAQIGHLGEFIASKTFHITLAPTAVEEGIDGHFSTGPLKGRSVDIKWYAKREGLLDVGTKRLPDFYLVMTGPADASGSSRGMARPWLIDAVYLFETPKLLDSLRGRGVKIGIATSVHQELWDEAEIYPTPRSQILPVTGEQRWLLELFRG